MKTKKLPDITVTTTAVVSVPQKLWDDFIHLESFGVSHDPNEYIEIEMDTLEELSERECLEQDVYDFIKIILNAIYLKNLRPDAVGFVRE